jgi:phosphopantetheinyl transferase (holo-ACP synthase)
MAHDVLGILNRIQQFESRAVGEFNEQFAAATGDFRKRIRQSIRERLSPETESLMNLDLLPTLPDWSISISHCQSLGGWIAIPKPNGIGLDIERLDRITTKVVNRIAQEGELDNIPDPLLLWCAKESYFKALGPAQPIAITQLRIEKWVAEAEEWRFSSPQMHGTSFTAVDLVVSISLVDDVSKREK